MATLLHNAGHHVRVIDNNSFYKYYTTKDFIKIVSGFKPAVLGFSVTLVNAAGTYELLKELKAKFKDIIHIAGGMHVKDCYREVLENGFDLVVNREAEMVILPLVFHLENRSPADFKVGLDHIPGISYFRDDGVLSEASVFPTIENLDDVPFVNYDLFNIGDFLKTKREPAVFFIIGQRGCPFRCNFCSNSSQRADSRIASADYMFRYINYMHQKYGSTYFWIADNNFFIQKKRTVRFCELMISSGMNSSVTITCQTRVETAMDDALLKLARKAGIVKIGFGLERMDKYSQEMVQKTTPAEKIIKALSLAKKNDISVYVNMIIGFPFETMDTLRNESDGFHNLRKYAQNIACNVLSPVPGTCYYDDYPEIHQWYLNPALIRFNRSYYSHVLDLIMLHMIQLNLYGFSQQLVREQKDIFMRFKLLNHGQIIKNQKPHVSLLKSLDRLIAQFSRLVYLCSPEFELWLFRKVKSARYRLAVNIFSRDMARKKAGYRSA